MRRTLMTISVLVLAFRFAFAQGNTSADKKELLQQKVAAIKESMAQNQASLRHYTWTAHTECCPANQGSAESASPETVLPG